MDQPFPDAFTASYKAFMTALFVGIADALICLVFNIAYREQRPYFSSDLLNVSYLIFGSIFLFSIIGLIYLLALKLKNGNILFMVFFIVLTSWTLVAIHGAHFSPLPIENASFRGELTGITYIMGISIVAGIPLLHRSHKFELYVV